MTSTTDTPMTDAPAAAVAAWRARQGPGIDEPGVYDIPFDAYLRHPALSKSKMFNLLETCPAQFLYDLEHPQPPKKEYDFGTAAHKLLLGVGAEIAVIDADNYRDKGAARDRDFAREDGMVPLLAKDYAKALAMVEVVRRHPIAGRLFIEGKPEQSLFWTDPESGVQMRARLDWLGEKRDSRLMLVDFKTAKAVDLASIEKAIFDYGYHMQRAQYVNGAIALGLGDDDTDLAFVFQSKTPPYLVRVVQLEMNAIRLGRARIRKAIAIYLECLESGHWYGYDETSYAALPAYGERRDEEEYL